jgi:O-antigen/teichoic acid export membrane protein
VSTTRRAANNLLKLTSGHLATVVALTLSGILIPRALGIEAYGRYAAVLAVVAILRALSTLGLQQVGVRFLSPLWRSGDSSEALVLGSTLWTVRLALAPLVGLLGGLWLSQSVASEEGLWVLVALGAFCALRSAQEATRGLFLPIGHVGKLAGFELFYVLARLPLVLLCFREFGLAGVFIALSIFQGVVWVATTISLLRIFPLDPRRFKASVLKPYLSYGLSSWITAACNVLQAQLGVFALAAWVAARDAAHLALAMQFYLLARGLYLPVQRALMPILSEIESAGETERLRRWGSFMLKGSIAVSCLMTIAWAMLGNDFLRILFGTSFVPAYPVAAVLFSSLVFLTAGLTCHALLFVRCRAGIASLATVFHTAAVLGGLALVLTDESTPDIALRVAWVYVAASALFFACTYTMLRWRAGLHLPLGASLLLALPVTIAVPVANWEAPWAMRLLALLVFMLGYGWLATHLKLLNGTEVTALLRQLQKRGGGGR